MKYCQRCILPDSRPGVLLDSNGICLPCRNSSTKSKINWDERLATLRSLIEECKNESNGYDCIIPVSGGKDSTWQVVKCLEFGLKPLAVTWKTPARTELGTHNLKCLVDLGVDHIDYQISPEVERKFMYKALVKMGSPAVPMHMAMFAIPLTIASKYEIPLIIWGENSAFEYGSRGKEVGFRLTARWLSEHGNTFGTTAKDWIDRDLPAKDLTAYFGPDPDRLENQGIRAIFLGYFLPWDPQNSLQTAMKHGFQIRKEGPKTGYYNYADIDDDFISIHHYIKWYKFGCTRLFDNLSIEIREGRLTRTAAIDIVRKMGEQRPDEDITKMCRFLRIDEAHFYSVLETHRNHSIWNQEDGKWKIRDFLIPDWNWT